MKLNFIKSVPVAKNIRSFLFEKPDGYDHVAGQYIHMTLEHDNPDDRGVKRYFTLSCSPTEEHLAITTKWAGDKASTFKKALFNLQAGDMVDVTEADGDFTLPDDKHLKLIFVAGGIGVTPYHSMVKYLLDSGEKRQIKLLYAAQDAEELCFVDMFKEYGVDLQPFINKRLTVADLMAEVKERSGKLLYVSGPEPMVESLHDQLVEAGLPDSDFKADYFPGYHNDYSR